MEGMKVPKLIAVTWTLLVISVHGQISTPCTSSLISTFTPCLNFITGSSSNGSSPTASCCKSFSNLMSTSINCACLIVTANIPIQLPINRTLALSLPRACKTSVPFQCKASGSPLPAPGPMLLGPPPPGAASPFSPQASKAAVQAPAPQSEAFLPLTPVYPPAATEAPPATTGIRPVFNPTASVSSHLSPSISLLLFIAIVVFRCN